MRNFKKMAFAISVFVLSAALSTAVFAAEQDTSIKLNLNGKAVVFNDSNKPIIINGSTMLQLRAMFDLLNEDDSYSLDWSDSDKMATLKSEETTIKLWADNGEAEVNGEKVKINGTAPTIINSRIYVPFRFLAESFGLTVNWNPVNYTIGAMDDETLSLVSGLMNDYNEKYDINSKMYMELKYDANMTMTMGDESQNVDMVMDMTIEQDLANKYQHIKTNMYMLGLQQNMETYDDGVNSYTDIGTGFTKGESTLGAMLSVDYIEQMQSQFDLNAMAELEESSYAAMLIKTDASGNYILEGNILIPDDLLKSTMDSMFGNMGMEDMANDITVSLPEPIYFVYVINKDTGALMAMDMNFKANMAMDIMGEKIDLACSYKASMPKINMNATFESVVPDSVKSGA